MPDTRLLEITDEASKHARRIFYLYIGFLTYCALTVVSTKDRQLVIPGEDVKLPIVDIEVSLEGFFIVAPIICILLFVFYRLYSHRLHSLISQLTGEPEKMPYPAEKLYPWMVNIAHKPDSGIIGRLQSLTVSLTTWYMLPLVLFLFAFWYLKKHDPVMSWVIGVAVPVLGTATTLWFWNVSDMQGNKIKWDGHSGGIIINLFILFIFSSLIFIPSVNDGYFKFANLDLSYQVLVEVPEKEKDFENVYWVNLSGANLRGANLESSVLRRADLRGADLTNVNLFKSNLESTNLNNAKIINSDLAQALLTNADLKHASLQGSYLDMTNFAQAKLNEINLTNITINKMNFQDASLICANFKDTDIRTTNFQGATLKSADFRNSKLFSVDFRNSDLRNANFEGAEISVANFEGANINRANFQKTKLLLADLSKVTSLKDAKLEDNVLKQIKKRSPLLLDKKNLLNLLIEPISEYLEEQCITEDELRSFFRK